MLQDAQEIGWAVARMTCCHCGHRWVAVYEIGTEAGECRQCGGYTVLPTSIVPTADPRAN